MMGKLVAQEQLFYRFRIEDNVPADHLLRRIDPLLDLRGLRPQLEALYSRIGRVASVKLVGIVRWPGVMIRRLRLRC